MKGSILPLLERAVLVALASSCGSSGEQTDGGPDAGGDATADAPNDATLDAAAAPDADDGGAVDVVQPLPLPDGCTVSGKPDAFAPCGYSETIDDPVACGVDVDADTQDAGVCHVLCDPTEPDCVYYDLANGDAGDTYIVTCGAGCIGRLHDEARADLEGRCAPARREAGALLARAAALEAGAVVAFEILAAELARFGAPADLVRGAELAAADERVHATVVGDLARRFGREPDEPTVPASRRRALRAMAVENATEGCVRETFGAALAAWQAARATDGRVRAAMQDIARDEARHADLGWRIDAWLEAVAPEADVRAMRDARARSVRALERSIDETYGAGEATLGLPSRADALALFRALQPVWSA